MNFFVTAESTRASHSKAAYELWRDKERKFLMHLKVFYEIGEEIKRNFGDKGVEGKRGGEEKGEEGGEEKGGVGREEGSAALRDKAEELLAERSVVYEFLMSILDEVQLQIETANEDQNEREARRRKIPGETEGERRGEERREEERNGEIDESELGIGTRDLCKISELQLLKELKSQKEKLEIYETTYKEILMERERRENKLKEMAAESEERKKKIDELEGELFALKFAETRLKNSVKNLETENKYLTQEKFYFLHQELETGGLIPHSFQQLLMSPCAQQVDEIHPIFVRSERLTCERITARLYPVLAIGDIDGRAQTADVLPGDVVKRCFDECAYQILYGPSNEKCVHHFFKVLIEFFDDFFVTDCSLALEEASNSEAAQEREKGETPFVSLLSDMLMSPNIDVGRDGSLVVRFLMKILEKMMGFPSKTDREEEKKKRFFDEFTTFFVPCVNKFSSVLHQNLLSPVSDSVSHQFYFLSHQFFMIFYNAIQANKTGGERGGDN